VLNVPAVIENKVLAIHCLSPRWELSKLLYNILVTVKEYSVLAVIEKELFIFNSKSYL